MNILGIDNGLDGGLVLLSDIELDQVKRAVEAAAQSQMPGPVNQPMWRIQGRLVMPTLNAGTAGRREYDLATIVDCMNAWKPTHAFIERAHGMPGQGISSTFSIGKGFGIMLGLLAAMKIPTQVVSAQTWQKVMFEGIARDDTKAASLLVAQRLFPGVDWRASAACRKAHHGLTDAALLAEYGRRSLGCC